MTWANRTIIVTAADAALARALCEGLAGESGAGMFTSALSPSGSGPATHFISSGMIEDAFSALLVDAGAMFAAAQQAGAPVTLAQCQALVADSTVTDADAEGPFATLERLGLRLVQPPGA